MDITIQMLGESHTLRVNPQDTVGYLKSRIQDKLRVAPHKQRLIFDNGKRTTLDEDSKTISDYNLQSGSLLSLLIIKTFQVFLKRETGDPHTYDITADMTVKDFKIEVEARERVPVSQQRLVHESREMNEGKLSDYNVKELSTIYLMLRLRGG